MKGCKRVKNSHMSIIFMQEVLERLFDMSMKIVVNTNIRQVHSYHSLEKNKSIIIDHKLPRGQNLKEKDLEQVCCITYNIQQNSREVYCQEYSKQ